MRRPLVSLFLLTFVLAACDDSGPSAVSADAADGPLLTLQDGTTEGGNPHFFFLPPLVSNPGFSGVADLERSPRVVICLPSNGDCNELDSFDARVTGQHYQAQWRPAGLSLNTRYHVEVWLGEVRLGYVAVTFVQNARAGQGLEGVVLVGLNRNVPVQFRIEEGALVAALADECEIDENVLDCDVTEFEPGENLESTVVDPVVHGHIAGVLKLPGNSSNQKLLSVFKHIDGFSQPPSGLPGNPIKYFLKVNLFDEDGNLFTEDLDALATLVLCLEDHLPPGHLFHLLRIFRAGNPSEILPTSHDATECEPNGHLGSLHGGRWGVLNRVAGLFRAQPLGALHGGLHTTVSRFSEFGAVQDAAELDSAPFLYGEVEFEWESSVGSDSGVGPFFTTGDFAGTCPNLDVSEGTGGGSVWPLGGTGTGQESDITLTKHFLVPSGDSHIRVWAAIDNDIKVILNGVDITGTFAANPNPPALQNPSSFTGLVGGFLVHEGCAWVDSVSFEGVAIAGVNTLEIVARDRGTIGYVDIRVDVFTPED